MINTLRIFVAIAIVAVLQSCGSKERKTESGLAYTMIKEGEGGPVEDGQYILMNMQYKDETDSVWMNTADNGIPVIVPKNDSVWKANEGSIEQIFNELKKGDSVTFSISVEDFFANSVKADLPPNVNKESTLTFNLGVADVLNQDEIMAWQQEMMKKQQQKQEADATKQLTEDVAIIEEYLKENGIEAQKTESGIFYTMEKEGTGEQAAAGDMVKVNYVGRILNGPYFDTSYKEVAQKEDIYDERREPYEPLEFKLGQGQMIRGWDEGIPLLKEGGKATLYIPSPLAYGPRQRSAEIVPNSILVFDVELVDVVKDENN
ncbi:Peptidylprolyl isomerase [Fulvivirga imtechensis AK7]|uniref:Peptidyl-prolyl cis-trans isomerase n=1 Tax=Fulvivirga imtechensis AK7 TaxID=1237149 RepID=L8JUF7_9BACT|nr:FKBP-type peptidyl-prolyl cis-trans isomerase [Fulvivirga imtechensis]ELR70922.1 Peptidylprolyl isomerase [Fulvivirga imtechensis AK7]